MDRPLTVAPHQRPCTRYGAIHAIIRHVHKCTNRVRRNQTTQDLVGNDGRVILTKKTNQYLLQCERIIGMR